MPYYCTVPRCTSMAGKARDVSFHQFPRDARLADRWNVILKRGKPYTKYSKVCSRHFTAQDYTCTTVGKNKGHWRTLRKDAVPSQNLPGEPPSPYRAHAPRADVDSLSDQQIQQQLAHAVYVQTMLAVHAASVAAARHSPPAPDGSCDEDDSRESSEAREIASPDAEEPRWHPADSVSDASPAAQKPERHPQAVEPAMTAFKCEDCSKCFKDPDVFLLHKRWHMNARSRGEEPPDDVLSEMLRPTRAVGAPAAFDPTNLEHQILLAMRSNMESYIKTMAGAGRGLNGGVTNGGEGSGDEGQNGTSNDSDHDSGDRSLGDIDNGVH